MAYDEQIGSATVFMEAAQEPPEGKLGVASVIVNRVRDRRRRYGSTIAQVCLAPLQFSSWNTTEPTRKLLALTADNDPALAASQQAMRQAMTGEAPDPTLGAVLYYADWMRTPPKWATAPGVTFTAKIGRHLFFTAA